MLSSENEAGGTAVENLVHLDWGPDSFSDFDELIMIAYCKAKWSAMIIDIHKKTNTHLTGFDESLTSPAVCVGNVVSSNNPLSKVMVTIIAHSAGLKLRVLGETYGLPNWILRSPMFELLLT